MGWWSGSLKSVAFSATRAADLLGEMAVQADAVIARVERHLPDDFPAFISEAIFSSLRKQLRRSSDAILFFLSAGSSPIISPESRCYQPVARG
mgnify:CR=1 FL=1